MKETIKNVFDLDDSEEYTLHSNLVFNIAKTLIAKEFRDFELDEYNSKIMRFLLLYFNKNILAESVFPDENYKIHKQIMLIGKVGVGKTLLMQIFSEYLRITKNANTFTNISVTEMINYYKINNHLDKYTFNMLSVNSGYKTNATNFCLNDLGLDTHLHFGVNTKVLIDDFLYSRYELYINFDIKAHITSNLSVSEMKELFDVRISDRFKSYNIIDMGGISRRK